MSTQKLYNIVRSNGFRPLVGMALLTLAASVQAKDIPVVGTGDGMPVLSAVSEAFGKVNPGLNFVIPPSIGSGGAIVAVGSGREAIGRVARPLTASEEASGILYRPVFFQPTAFFVHPGVPVRDLTVRQLSAIFAGEIANWKEVGGPDLRVRVVRREEADSSLAVFRWSFPEFKDLKLTPRSKFAMTTQEAFESIRDNPGAIGFGPYSTQLAKALGAVSIDGRSPSSKDYPARVTLALIYKQDRLSDELKRYLDFYASDEARAIITSFGARPAAP